MNNAQTHRKILHMGEFSDNMFHSQIDIVSFRATDTTGKEGKREAEGAPLSPILDESIFKYCHARRTVRMQLVTF